MNICLDGDASRGLNLALFLWRKEVGRGCHRAEMLLPQSYAIAFFVLLTSAPCAGLHRLEAEWRPLHFRRT